MSDISGPYCNHVGSTTDGAGNLYSIATQDGPASGDVDVVVKRCDASADPSIAASWYEVYRFRERDFGKHGYGSAEFRGADMVALLAERNTANETVARVHVIPGIGAAGDANGGVSASYVSAPNGAIRVFVAPSDGFDGTLVLTLPTSIPPCSALNVRLCIAAGAVGRRCQIGARATSIEMLTAETQALAPVYAWAQGAVAPGAGNTLTLMADTGRLTKVFVDVHGWWP